MIRLDYKENNYVPEFSRKDTDFVTLSLDQSTSVTGYSIFVNGDLLYYGQFKPSPKKEIFEKINDTANMIQSLIDIFNPNFIVAEDVQLQVNAKVLILLSKLLGIIEYLAHRNNIKFFIVHPKTWKSVCGIKGRKRKEQKENTKIFIKETFGIDVPEDIADAISINYFLTKKIEKGE